MENEYLKKFDYQNEIYFEEDKNPYFEMEHYIEDEDEYFIDQIDSYGGVDGIVVS